MNQSDPVNPSREIRSLAVQACKALNADALLYLAERKIDWELLKSAAGKTKVLIAAEDKEIFDSAVKANLDAVLLTIPEAPVYEKLTQALLSAVANEQLVSGAEVVALYTVFDQKKKLDSISYIRLDEHLGRLTARDLRNLDTNVPLKTLKAVVDLAVEIGQEGREGKPVGTLFVVGDSRKVLSKSQAIGFDAVKGYNRKERNLHDPRVRESMKEIAMLDGAFIVSSDGTVEASCRHLNASTELVTLSKGLGTRHWAAAGISKETKAVAIAVSESNGTVRLFQNGEVLLRIEPFRRPMKWKDFEDDSND